MFSAFKNLPKTFGHAWDGIRILLFAEKHSLFLWLGAGAGVLLSHLLKVNKTEWLLVLLAIGTVFAAEAMNTAVEQAVDLASPEQHPIAKKAKDLAAGAVLITVITATTIGLLIFVPKIIANWF